MCNPEPVRINIDKIAAGIGAKVVGQVPDTGGGAFGAARLAKIVEAMQTRPVASKPLSESIIREHR